MFQLEFFQIKIMRNGNGAIFHLLYKICCLVLNVVVAGFDKSPGLSVCHYIEIIQ